MLVTIFRIITSITAFSVTKKPKKKAELSRGNTTFCTNRGLFKPFNHITTGSQAQVQSNIIG
jgi:hypothetical protein